MLALPRAAKRALALVVDACLCGFTVWLALSLRFDAWVVLSGRDIWAVGVSLSLALPLFVKFGLYRAIFRYSGWPAFSAVAKAVAIYAVAYGLVFAAIGVPGVPRTIGLIQPLLLLLAVSASRLLARGWLGGVYQELLSRRELPRVLIYGAGDAGRKLAQALSASSELRLLGFLDDDERLQGGLIHGLPVHGPATLKEQAAALRVSDIFLAIPSASRQRRHEILEQVRQVRVSVRTLPGLMELAQGKVQVSDLRELDVEDLLGRNAVPPHAILLRKNIHGKVVLVTGAGGSIGSELCRQIVAGDAATLLLVERSEFALYTIHRELLQALEGRDASVPRIVPLLASVRGCAPHARDHGGLASAHGLPCRSLQARAAGGAQPGRGGAQQRVRHADHGRGRGRARRARFRAHQHRQGRAAHQHHGLQQAPGRDGPAGPGGTGGTPAQRHALLDGALRQRAGLLGLRGAAVPRSRFATAVPSR